MTEIPIRVLALDPGTEKFGIAVLDGKNMLVTSRQIKYPKWEKGIRDDADRHLNHKLYFLYKTLKQFLHEYNPDVTAIEIPTVNRNAIVSLSMCSAVLRVACMHFKKKTPVFRISPSSTRAAALGEFKAGVSKISVAEAIGERFGKRFWEDEADAIAIGLAYYDGKVVKRKERKKRAVTILVNDEEEFICKSKYITYEGVIRMTGVIKEREYSIRYQLKSKKEGFIQRSDKILVREGMKIFIEYLLK